MKNEKLTTLDWIIIVSYFAVMAEVAAIIVK
jgi:hypothetical protein